MIANAKSGGKKNETSTVITSIIQKRQYFQLINNFDTNIDVLTMVYLSMQNRLGSVELFKKDDSGKDMRHRLFSE